MHRKLLIKQTACCAPLTIQCWLFFSYVSWTEDVFAITYLAQITNITQTQFFASLKDKAIQTIKEKLKNQKVELEDNWEDQVRELKSAKSVAAFVQQVEKEIAEKSQVLGQVDNIPSPSKGNKSLLFFGMGMLIISLGGIIAWFIFYSRQKRTS